MCFAKSMFLFCCMHQSPFVSLHDHAVCFHHSLFFLPLRSFSHIANSCHFAGAPGNFGTSVSFWTSPKGHWNHARSSSPPTAANLKQTVRFPLLFEPGHRHAMPTVKFLRVQCCCTVCLSSHARKGKRRGSLFNLRCQRAH